VICSVATVALFKAASAFSEGFLNTNIYIDGFNLYYGGFAILLVAGLIRQHFARFCAEKTIAHIKYFTALVSARPSDPDQLVRQQLYLRALGTLPEVSVHLGHFVMHEVTPWRWSCLPDNRKNMRGSSRPGKRIGRKPCHHSRCQRGSSQVIKQVQHMVAQTTLHNALSDVASFGLSREEAIPVARAMQGTVKRSWEEQFKKTGFSPGEIERLRVAV
jgi:hypothetical protein